MGFSAEQKLAIEYIGGPQIVLAGPGSGKTLIIVEKAAYLVEQKGIKPDEVLILTYNNFTADELNNRLRKREKEKPLPEAKTFHSFGQRVIEQRYEILGYKDVPTVLGSFRKYLIQREAYFEAADIPPGLSSPDNIIHGINTFISRANDELVGPAELFGYIDKKEKELAGLADSDQLAAETEALTDLKFATRFYEIYNRKKVEKGFIDFDDMLFGLYRIFRHNQEALKIQRHKLKYILVDEFQDANSGQVETLALLAGSSGKICVVGDDDQSIYRFRGASYGSFVNFTRLFPNAVTHKLTINFRSTPPIVAASQTLISYKTQARFDPHKKIKSNNEDGRKIGAFISPETESEGHKVAGLIKAIMQDDPQIKPDDIAVISRAHDHRKEVRKALASEGIPAVEQRPVSVFSVFEAHLAASFLRGALADDQPEWLFPILLKYAPDLGPTIYSQISESLKSLKPFELLDNLKSDEQLSSLDKSGLEYAIGLLGELKANVPNCTPAELVEKLLVSSGLFSQSLTNDKKDDLASRALARLWAAAAEYEEEFGSDIREFLRYLIWTEQTDTLNLEPSNEKGVHLMTAHSAKGLEFSVVIVIGLSERKFPQDNRTGRFTLPQDLSRELPPPADAHIQEERRLMYVAMTRAAKRLYLSGLERQRVKISRFFSEVAASESFAEYGESIIFAAEEESTTDDSVIQIDDTNAYAVKIAEIIGGALNSGKERLADSIMLLTEKLWATLSHGKQKVSPDEFKKILTDIIGKCELKETPIEIITTMTKIRLSYTDIETYDKCPLQYKFKKILKVPEKTGPQIFLGEAIHGTLQEAMTKAMSDKMPTVDELKTIFLVKWQSYHHSDMAWMEGLKNAGLSMLEKFAEREKANKNSIIAIERKFTIDGDNFMLNGRIDRIDIDESGDIYIIDYKTGKIGMPEGSYEKKDDQLTVYAMACPSLFGKLPKAVTYYFLGDDKLVSNIISEKDINKVRERIGEIADNIISGNFEAKPSGFICPKCSYRTICPYKAE